MVSRLSPSRVLFALAILAVAFVLSGCIVSGSRNTKTTGDFVGAQTLSQIEPGVTDKAWILSVLGPPTRKSPATADGHEIWVWKSTRTRHAETKVLIIFDGDKHVTKTQRVYVEFQDDLVTRAWRDSSR